MAQVIAVFAELERRLIGERTKAALAAKRAQGVRLGRPAVLDPTIVERIVSEHRTGRGWSEIARRLNADGTPTAQGGAKWHPSTVRYVVMSQAA
jgi:DNA invertase Pin-like site-specific DNA recombinase